MSIGTQTEGPRPAATEYDPEGHLRGRELRKIAGHENKSRTGIRFEVKFKNLSATSVLKLKELKKLLNWERVLKAYLNDLAHRSQSEKRRLNTILKHHPELGRMIE